MSTIQSQMFLLFRKLGLHYSYYIYLELGIDYSKN